MNNILVLGSGELGHAIVTSLRQHPSFSPSVHAITTTVRPATISAPSRQSQLSSYQAQNIHVLPLDVESTPIEALSNFFATYRFTTIIHSGGMTLPWGTQLKITQAALDSPSVSLYIPWQFGLDYDAIGPTAAGGLFSEQHHIRQLLRSQTRVQWLIVSNGIFTSFMFEEFWGVVEGLGLDRPSNQTPAQNPLTLRALGSWTDTLAITTAEDIGRCTAELLLVDIPTDPARHLNRPVYISSQSLSYAAFADAVESVTGRKADRQLWTTDFLRSESAKDPENKLLKYRVVFSENVGTDWNDQDKYNVQKGMGMVGVEEWLRRKLQA